MNMKSFHWDKHFITGLPEIDKQHNYIVDIFNKFGDFITQNEIVLDDVNAIFLELFEYANYHFKEEEEMMSEMCIDQRHLVHHIESHRYFSQEIKYMHAAISSCTIQDAKKLLAFLTRWFAFHILGADQNMARQIRAIQSGIAPGEAYDVEEEKAGNSTEPLVIALEEVFQQLIIRNKDLQQLNKSLEQKVEERTKELQDTNQYLEKLSITDALTGLQNRRHAMLQLNDLWDESTETNNPLSCILIDVDHFKSVNDTYGHESGDLVLCELANVFTKIKRKDDIACRLGGDEFLIVCPNAGINMAVDIAELICKSVSELRVETGNVVWQGSISLGVSSRTSDMKNYKNLIKMADISVYAAKRDGKNCVRAIS